MTDVFLQIFLCLLSGTLAVFKDTFLRCDHKPLHLDKSASSSSQWFILKSSTSWGVNFSNTGIHQNFIKLSQANLSLRTLIKHQWMIYSTYGADLPLISLLHRYKSYKSPACSTPRSPRRNLHSHSRDSLQELLRDRNLWNGSIKSPPWPYGDEDWEQPWRRWGFSDQIDWTQHLLMCVMTETPHTPHLSVQTASDTSCSNRNHWVLIKNVTVVLSSPQFIFLQASSKCPTDSLEASF